VDGLDSKLQKIVILSISDVGEAKRHHIKVSLSSLEAKEGLSGLSIGNPEGS
jgi:predicted transcriptional regulator